MTWLQILILSLIQGATEFLPVSSSGHLILMPHLFGWQEQGLEMDVALHVGTLIAVLFYFAQDIRVLVANSWTWLLSGFSYKEYNQHTQLSMALAIGTIPAIIVGFTLKRYGLTNFHQIWVIGTTSIVFGLLLFIADHYGKKESNLRRVSLGTGFLIGLAQSLALIPGVSRSGACITAALALGYDRVSAARFAFLLSIPAILGAAILTSFDACTNPAISICMSDLLLGIIFSTIAGLVAISFMLYFLTRYSLTLFVVYRVLLGFAILLLL